MNISDAKYPCRKNFKEAVRYSMSGSLETVSSVLGLDRDTDSRFRQLQVFHQKQRKLRSLAICTLGMLEVSMSIRLVLSLYK